MFRYQSEIQPENAGEGILVKHLGAGQNMNVLHWILRRERWCPFTRTNRNSLAM